jgi:UDPglucose 6-dehydrogenase
MEIGFIGLGKLGLECSEVMALAKHNVHGYDIEKRDSLLVKQVDRIEETVIGKDFTFISVPTPHSKNYDGSLPCTHLPSKDFDYSIVKDVLRQIKDVKSNSIIVLISTVLPGTIRRELLPLVDRRRFIYNPYLIAMGTVSYDMRNPEMIIIGGESGENIDSLINFYRTIVNPLHIPRFEIGTFDEAEAIKIFYNTFISMKIGFVNMILDVAEKNGNINVDVVTQALTRSTKRIISDMYMIAGMGDGGACHPRDNIALSSLSERLELGYDIFGEVMKIREKQAENLAKVLSHFGNTVVILGSSYKPNVDLMDGSYSLLVASYIKDLEVYLDSEPETDEDVTYLIGHMRVFNDYNFRDNSVIVDPWGECKHPNVYYYGRRQGYGRH